jgi:hypothetical protein
MSWKTKQNISECGVSEIVFVTFKVLGEESKYIR